MQPITPTTSTTFDLLVLLRQQLKEVEAEQLEWRQRLSRLLQRIAQRHEIDALEQHRIAQTAARQERAFFQERVNLLTNIIECNNAHVEELNSPTPLRRQAAMGATQYHMSIVLAEMQEQDKQEAKEEDTEKRRALRKVSFAGEEFVL